MELFRQFDPTMAAYTAELLTAEALFCRSSPRRSRYGLRCVLLLPLVLLLSLVGPLLSPYREGGMGLQFLGLLLILSSTFAGMLFLHREELSPLLSSTVAGIAAQHAANKVYRLLASLPGLAFLSGGPLQGAAADLALTVGLTVPLYLLFGRSVRSDRRNPSVNLLSVGVVLICIGLNRFVSDSPLQGTGLWRAANIYAIVCCLLALWLRYYIFRWEQEKTRALMVGRLLTESEKQYGQWTATVREMAHSAHDIRHMLHRMERLAAEKRVEIPDMTEVHHAVDRLLPNVKTGNDVLDILLRNCYELCRAEGIRLQFFAGTDALRRFEGISLYFLMANAIDNAMEGAKKVAQPDKRLIDISIRSFGEAVAIHIWNYFQGGLSFRGEYPVSDAEGHGYGLRGMQAIVDRFSGTMSVRTEEDVFHLNLILPLPEEGTTPSPP